MRCKGLCDSIDSYNRYTDHSKFCAICGKYLSMENIGLRCPCCHSLFRVVPRKMTISLHKKRELLHRY